MRPSVPRRRLLLGLGFKYDSQGSLYEATGDAAVAFWSSGLATLPAEWERFLAKAPRIRMRRKLRPKVRVATASNGWFELDARLRVRGADGGPGGGAALAPHRPALHPARPTGASPRPTARS